MPKILMSILLLVIVNTQCNASVFSDTGKKHSFHVLLSAKPLINWASKVDSNSNFLNSKSLVEFQYQYKKHLIGLGTNFIRTTYRTQVNGLPFEELKRGYNFNPYYIFNVYSLNKIKLFAGIGYIVNNSKVEQSTTSNIEKITYTSVNKEEGANLILRLNYQLNSKLSIETDVSIYNLKSTYQYDEKYPLTPSLNFYKYSTLHKTHISLPANIFLKYSF